MKDGKSFQDAEDNIADDYHSLRNEPTATFALRRLLPFKDQDQNLTTTGGGRRTQRAGCKSRKKAENFG